MASKREVNVCLEMYPQRCEIETRDINSIGQRIPVSQLRLVQLRNHYAIILIFDFAVSLKEDCVKDAKIK